MQKTVFLPEEKKPLAVLTAILFFRMLAVFAVLPVFTLFAFDLENATPALVALAFGAYGLTLGLLQIPYGVFSDRWGRKKALLLALVLFFIGSLWAMVAEDIYSMIGARLTQGLGALSSAIYALVADHTREEVRTRAMARLGVFIGVAFALAFGLAPAWSAEFGLAGIFGMGAVLSLFCIFLAAFFIPTTKAVKNVQNWSLVSQAGSVKKLYPIYYGSGLAGFSLAFNLFAAQASFEQSTWQRQEIWKIYLPMLIAGLLLMLGIAAYAEIKHKFRQSLLLAGQLVCLAALIGGLGSLYPTYLFITTNAAMVLCFLAYCIFEPLLPSLATKMAHPNTKGTTSGFLSSARFLGHFGGSLLIGMWWGKNATEYAYWFLGALSLGFIWWILKFEQPLKKQPLS